MNLKTEEEQWRECVVADLKILKDRQTALAAWCFCVGFSSILLGIGVAILKFH